jgi:hypothetical protein
MVLGYAMGTKKIPKREKFDYTIAVIFLRGIITHAEDICRVPSVKGWSSYTNKNN